jgi:hypothetical protein
LILLPRGIYNTQGRNLSDSILLLKLTQSVYPGNGRSCIASIQKREDAAKYVVDECCRSNYRVSIQSIEAVSHRLSCQKVAIIVHTDSLSRQRIRLEVRWLKQKDFKIFYLELATGKQNNVHCAMLGRIISSSDY